MVALAIGLDSDPAMAHFLRYCSIHSVDIDFVNLRRLVMKGEWDLGIQNSTASITLEGGNIDLLRYDAVYARPISLHAYEADTRLRRRWLGLIESLTAWLQTTPLLVVNRPRAGAHNSAKPLHGALLASAGFTMPDSVTTSDPRMLNSFLSKYSGAVVKAIAGGRGDTQAFSKHDAAGFTRKNGPVHVEQRILGADVRVHVVGTDAVATHIDSDRLDYRTPEARPSYRGWVLPPDLRTKTVKATADFGLSFAGWDFKLDSSGTYWCLEVNPQPGYNLYDRYMNFEISRMLADLLRSAGRRM